MRAKTVIGALLIATLSTAFDVLWHELIPEDHGLFVAVVVGLLHGGALFAALGAWLGRGRAESRRRGIVGGLGAGLAASLSFYLLYPPLLIFGPGFAFIIALGLSWLLLWQLLAQLSAALSGGPLRSFQVVGIAGLQAGLGSLPGFAAIIRLWMTSGGDFPYAIAFLSWFGAYFVGMSALQRR